MEWWEYLVVVGVFSVVWLVVVYRSHDRSVDDNTDRYNHYVGGKFDPIFGIWMIVSASFFLLLLITYKYLFT